MSDESSDLQLCQALMQESANCFHFGQYDEAVRGLKKILHTIPKTPLSESEALKVTALKVEALKQFGKIVVNTDQYQREFSQTITCINFQINAWDEDLQSALLVCLQQPSINPSELVASCLRLLSLHSFSFNDPLLQALMSNAIIPDIKIEKLLRAKRNELLAKFRIVDFLESNRLFLYALALQCYLNEYVYAISPSEMILIDDLCEHLASVLPVINENTKLLFALLSSYCPLHKTQFAQLLLMKASEESDPFFSRILKTQIIDPLSEKEIAATIPCLDSIKDTTSQKVREQYEENPYPRWSRLDFQVPYSFQEILLEMFPRIQGQPIFLSSPPKILVAGCGTGQHALNYALNNHDSQLTAIDLSLSSLSYAKRMANELKISNVRFFQSDILELKGIDEKFELIECCGVLHHMQDPLAGWRSLTHLLSDHGWMFIGLYSKLGRRRLEPARQFIKDRGYEGTLDDIPKCRQEIFNMPNNDPIKAAAYWQDFYSLSTCRDLLFHVHEVQFTTLQLEEILKQLNLEFMGFYVSPTVESSFKSMFPNDPLMVSLQNWHQFEQKYPDTFSTMYLFWVVSTLSKSN